MSHFYFMQIIYNSHIYNVEKRKRKTHLMCTILENKLNYHNKLLNYTKEEDNYKSS